jgi:hypothetical protein
LLDTEEDHRHCSTSPCQVGQFLVRFHGLEHQIVT